MAVTLLESPDDLMLSRNPIAYLLQSDLVGTDIRFIVRLEVESEYGANDFVQVGEFEKVANANKEMDFDFSCVLHTLLEHINPDPLSANLAVGNTHCKRYRINYADTDDSTPPSFTLSDNKYVLLGAWNVKQYPNRGSNTLPTANQIMTTRPQASRQFLIGQYEWLWLLPSSGGTNIELTITVNYTDGTQTIMPVVDYLTNTEIYKPIGIPLHDSIHNYSALDPTKEIESISFAALGETISVKPDFDYFNYLREFIYLNSCGGFDSLITYGKGQRTEETTKNTAEVFRPYNYSNSFRQNQTFNSQTQASETVSIGYRSKAERDSAIDMIRSEIVWLRDGTNYCPIFINSDSVEFEQDGDYRYKIDFEFFYSNQEIGVIPA